MTVAMHPTIVVGVDGTTASLAALCWAACEARRWGAQVRVVRSLEPAACAPGAPPEAEGMRVQQRR